jgi:hypothetical protein
MAAKEISALKKNAIIWHWDKRKDAWGLYLGNWQNSTIVKV